ncbi:MAG: hypothetical protein AAF674_00220 [Pseudomonadota bacterium]
MTDQPVQAGPPETSIELYRRDGEDSRTVWLEQSPEKIAITTQDMGPLVEEMWGDSDYEFWTDIRREAYGSLLNVLMADLLRADANATETVRNLCRENGLDHQWRTWAQIPPQAHDTLLALLLTQRYRNDSKATDNLRTLCQEHDIAHTWQSWA